MTESSRPARPPAAPPGLGRRGKALWRNTLRTFELRQDELDLLTEACRTADLLDVLEAALVGAELTTTGSAGQLRSHPVLSELRQHRLTLARLVNQLQLADVPEESEDAPAMTPRQVRAQSAARARWARPGGRGGAS